MYELAVQMLQPDPDDSDEQKHEKAGAAGMGLMAYFAELLGNLRKNGHGKDLISELDQAHIGDVKLTGEEILGLYLLRVPVGFDTTASAIGRMLRLCAPNTKIRRAFAERVDDSQALDVAVGELIRHLPGARSGPNRNQPGRFTGQTIKHGHRLLLWPSANRNSDEFVEPNDVRGEPQTQPPHRVWFGHPSPPGRPCRPRGDQGTAGGDVPPWHTLLPVAPGKAAGVAHRRHLRSEVPADDLRVQGAESPVTEKSAVATVDLNRRMGHARWRSLAPEGAQACPEHAVTFVTATDVSSPVDEICLQPEKEDTR